MLKGKSKIKEYKTNELVEELRRRDGVEIIIAGPYTEYSISVEDCKYEHIGPAIILKIID